MKAIISNRIYLQNPGKEITEKITKALTYKIKKDIGGSKNFQAVETIKNYKILPKGIISIPQGRFDLLPEGCEIDDRRTFEYIPFPEPKYPLFEEQKVVYDQVVDTCFINALVGWGKCFAL